MWVLEVDQTVLYVYQLVRKLMSMVLGGPLLSSVGSGEVRGISKARYGGSLL